MKMIISQILFFLCVSVFSLNAADIPLREDLPVKPKTLVLIPVSADYTSPDLTFEFAGNVGVSIIIIKDINNNVVEQVNIDTANTLIETIDTSDWSSGTYYISVQIGIKTYIGEFTI